MKSRGSLRSTRESSSCGVWCKALSPHSTELQFLCSPEAGTLSLQTVSLGKLVINCNMFLLIVVNHIFSKTFFLGMSQMGRPPPGRFRVNAPKLGGARAAQRKSHYFFLALLVIFFSETVESLADLFRNFEQAPSLENGRLYG